MANVFWTEGLPRPERPPVDGDIDTDVCIVGAGFTGLWTALELLERDPATRVTAIEAETVGYGASGRNGGFLDISLTHGLANGLRHFPREIRELERLAADNYERMRKAFATHGIDCDFEPTGATELATRPHEVPDLAERAALERRFGHEVELHTSARATSRLATPRVLAALHRPECGGVLDPGRLVTGLASAAERLGVRVAERTPVTGMEPRGPGMTVHTPTGRVRCERVVLATNAYSGPLLPRTGHRYLPVYDYVLVTRPLTPGELRAVGWPGREGMSDAGNQFHYFRLTADDRILWGGYDAVYHSGNRVEPSLDDRPATYDRLARHFRDMFPMLDIGFTHRWGGPIATTSRFTAAFGEAFGGRCVYALGYTGLGVAATCFAARVLADLLTDPGSPLLELDYVRRPPFPFPPEPLRTAVVAATRHALSRADDTGRRGVWLRLLDAMRIGFDS